MDILSRKNQEFRTLVREAPQLPGVYIFLGNQDKVLYIGKAKVLKKRITSYFNNFSKLPNKIKQMLFEAKSIKFITVDTEIEALILETNLIKKYRPKYNTVMKDDKNYIFVRFEKVRKSNQKALKDDAVYKDFPTITITRKKTNDGAIYFGPYPHTQPIRRVLKKLRKIFPYCTNYKPKTKNQTSTNKPQKPCFYYHIGLCKGACAGLESKEEYIKRYKQLLRFFKGEKNKIIKDLEKKMKEHAQKLDFESAARIRDMINDINYATKSIIIEESFDDLIVEEHLKTIRKEALADLIERLKFPTSKLKKHLNFRIECYDISNLQGTNATGSMVVQIDGKAAPSLYRRFKIRTQNAPNDFLMLQEVLARRFFQFLQHKKVDSSNIDSNILKRMKSWKYDESFSQKPDLIIIDGGKGQLSAVYEVLKIFKLDSEIPIVGLAKKNEEIFKIKKQFNENTEITDATFEKITLPRNTESLYLIQRIRDEAHRFAKQYHQKLRIKNMF
jgi:excinuclease ABC subunit C